MAEEQIEITEKDVRKLFRVGDIRRIDFKESLIFVDLDKSKMFEITDCYIADGYLIRGVSLHPNGELISLSLCTDKIKKLKLNGWLK